MQAFLQNPVLAWGLFGLLAVAGFFAVLARIQANKIKQEAQADWAYRVREDMQDLRVGQDGYARAYCAAHTPRKAKTIAKILAALALLTVPAFALIERVLHYIWMWSGQSRVFEPPFLVWQFSIFFSILACWIAIIAFFLRRHYRHSPKLMRDLLLEERQLYTPKKSWLSGQIRRT